MTCLHMAPYFVPPLPRVATPAPEVCPPAPADPQTTSAAAPDAAPAVDPPADPPAHQAADPLAIDPAVPVSAWAAERLDFHADPFQQQILDTPTPRLALCCSRQSGKSTVAAVKGLHFAAANPGSLILFAAPSSRQAVELLRKFRGFAERLLNGRVKSDPAFQDSILLPNGSRIIALPQSPATIRGFSAPALIIVDEAGFVEDEMFRALSPMLAVSNGQRWYLSTANGCTGEFHRVFTGDDQLWTRFKLTADQCPRISAEFLAGERLALGQQDFDREYMCVFSSSRYQYIPEQYILDAVCDPYEQLHGDKK